MIFLLLSLNTWTLRTGPSSNKWKLSEEIRNRHFIVSALENITLMVFNVVKTNGISSISQVLVGQDIFDEIHCDGPFDYSCLLFDFQINTSS